MYAELNGCNQSFKDGCLWELKTQFVNPTRGLGHLQEWYMGERLDKEELSSIDNMKKN